MNKMIRNAENEIVNLYAKAFKFSKNLMKHEDDVLKEKYDHNFFEYDETFEREELAKALEYQMNRGDDFLKFFGRRALQDSFHMEAGTILAMSLVNNDTSKWKINHSLVFNKPSIEEIQQNDLLEYGEIFGESFVLKNVIRLYEKIEYVGAYINNGLVASCAIYINKECVCIDEMLVAKDYRNHRICTSLLKHIVDSHQNKKIFLHASDEDTAKELYQKLGFIEEDRQYEYQIIGLKEYQQKYLK